MSIRIFIIKALEEMKYLGDILKIDTRDDNQSKVRRKDSYEPHYHGRVINNQSVYNLRRRNMTTR